MADSIEAIISLPDMTAAQHQACTLPGKILRPVDLATGEADPPFHRLITVKSPINGIEFQVQGLWRPQPKDAMGHAPSPKMSGYKVLINVASATVGNNCVLRNGVPAACELTMLMLKIWLLEEGAPVWLVQQLDFERMRLTMVTPTFLHRFETHPLAKAARVALLAAMEIHNAPKFRDGKRQKQRKKAFVVGDSDDGSAYLKLRDRALLGYVKNQFTVSAAIFGTEEDHDVVFSEAELYLRVEPKLHAAWLKENNLDRPDNWRLYGQEVAYRKVYDQIRVDLRLDEGLRGTDPTPGEIQVLAESDQTVLASHLAGGIARMHALILAKPTKLAQQQYFSDMKIRVMKRLGVDLSIPWTLQKAAFSTGLGDVLHYPGMYVPPPAIEHLVFGESTVATAKLTLQQMIAAKMPRTLANLVLPTVPAEERLIQLGQLHVSEQAQRTLDLHSMPLHHLLQCHMLGCFGEVGLAEAEQLTASAHKHEPVMSRYPVGYKMILVSTEYCADGAGQTLQTTRVSCSNEDL